MFGFGNVIQGLTTVGGGENSVLNDFDLYRPVNDDEVMSRYWKIADGFESATITQLAAYHGNGGATLGIHNPGNKNQDIILVSTNKTDAFEGANVSNFHLANLNFHYPSTYISSNSEQPDSFVKAYKKKYGIEPNKFAARGFDLTLDVLLRLASDDDLYKASTNAIETKYSENKFRYSKKLSGGYYNEAVYIVRYTPDLTIEEAKL